MRGGGLALMSPQIFSGWDPWDLPELRTQGGIYFDRSLVFQSEAASFIAASWARVASHNVRNTQTNISAVQQAAALASAHCSIGVLPPPPSGFWTSARGPDATARMVRKVAAQPSPTCNPANRGGGGGMGGRQHVAIGIMAAEGHRAGHSRAEG